MVEYDLTTFAAKTSVKVPPEAASAPGNIAVNGQGQILFAQPVALPLSEDDLKAGHKVWFWNGHEAVTIDQGVKRAVAATGSNQAITESAPVLHLSTDGTHLFWFSNQAHRLQRDALDLSTATTFQVWRTDLTGGAREDLATLQIPECRCETGTCEETCPYCGVWIPEGGVGKFFLLTQSVAGQTEITYEKSALYREQGGKWTGTPLDQPLQRGLDADPAGDVIVDAIPDAGCCGWVNQSDDQTVVRNRGKNVVVFDERETYKNPDYDVSFYTSNARLSPELGYVAMTIVATADANQPIQLADEGQANPEESKAIRKALADLPAVEVKSLEDSPRRVAFVPHAILVGWVSEKEVLIVENHLLAAYNVATGARRKSTIRVDDALHVFLR